MFVALPPGWELMGPSQAQHLSWPAWPWGIRDSSTQSSPGREENHQSTKRQSFWLQEQPLFELEEVLVHVCFDLKRGIFSLLKAEVGQK